MTTRFEDVRDPRAAAEELCMDLSRPNVVIDGELRARWPRIAGMWWEVEQGAQSGWAYNSDGRILAKLVHARQGGIHVEAATVEGITPKPPCHCTRRSLSHLRDDIGGQPITWRECRRCLGYLPLGPSNESKVPIEVRAAEIAADLDTAGGAGLGDDEETGFCLSGESQTAGSEQWQAGYLARVIYDHARETVHLVAVHREDVRRPRLYESDEAPMPPQQPPQQQSDQPKDERLDAILRASERKASALERIAAAIEKIADYMETR